MLHNTLERTMALVDGGLHSHVPLIVCNQDHRFLEHEQCLTIGHTPTSIYVEHADRNTAPAIALAILHLSQGENGDPEARMLILVADHVITNQSAFSQAVAKATCAARVSYLMTFGIQHKGPESGYVYIQGCCCRRKPGCRVGQAQRQVTRNHAGD